MGLLRHSAKGTKLCFPRRSPKLETHPCSQTQRYLVKLHEDERTSKFRVEIDNMFYKHMLFRV
jgi:hypothetical protein